MYTRMLFAFVTTIVMSALATSFSIPGRVMNDELAESHEVVPLIPDALAPDLTSPDFAAVMLFAGLKSLALCGVEKDDRRVEAALQWIGANYTLNANPGMTNPRFRLYDYYRALATAMTLLEIDIIVDGNSTRHNWRRELVSVLQDEQRGDGSWTNRAEARSSREAHPFLTTSYAMITLHEIVNGPVRR